MNARTRRSDGDDAFKHEVIACGRYLLDALNRMHSRPNHAAVISGLVYALSRHMAQFIEEKVYG
jgi:hypothetical protein